MHDGRKSLKFRIIVIALFLFLPAVLNADGPGALALVKKIDLPGVRGRIDHMAYDGKRGRLFVAALGNDTLEVVDVAAGRVIKSVGGLSEPQGVAFIPATNRICAASGGSGGLSIYDGESYRLLSTVTLDGDADNLRYDAGRRRLYAAYGSGGIAAIDPGTGKAMGAISLPGHPEAFVLNRDGSRLYVNVPRPSRSVFVIDLLKHEIAAAWTVGDWRSNGFSNFSVCLDEDRRRLFVTTFVPSTLKVIDADTGKQVAELPIPADCDDLFYDAAARVLYLSCGEGYIDVILQESADRYRELRKIPTAPGARTSLWDGTAGMLFTAAPARDGREAAILVYRAGEGK